ncbi:transglycosylase SLT domain-containing protein [Acetobacter pasteurianus]|uniref:transglycosylase SLT domain-containing protein n=1 Tax=Acetobacter pasteurianus TaxID=438 RepID=UPI003D115BE0
MTSRQISQHKRCSVAWRGKRLAHAAKGSVILGLLALLSACANQPSGDDITMPVAEEAARYRAHARSYYAPPGTAEDPWGPYIQEASKRFDVPDEWIRAVIQQESGGRLFHNGQLVTSGPGAMGLMQLMPPTYDEMRQAYNLGDDAFDPHDNIMAGTGYIRQLYDVYGSPGFLAAYNAGPGRLEDFLTRNRTLPRETRNYVASIGRRIVGISPTNRSQADLLVASHDSMAQSYQPIQSVGEVNSVKSAWAQRSGNSGAQPVQLAEVVGSDGDSATTSYTPEWQPVARKGRLNGLTESPADVRAAWAQRLGSSETAASTAPVQVADASDPIPNPPEQPTAPARLVLGNTSSQRRVQMFPAAHAEPAPLLTHRTRGDESKTWAIQVGAFGTQSMAQSATGQARNRAALSGARAQIASVQAKTGKLYRARLTNLSHEEALNACRKLSGCVVISPGSRS